MKAIAITLMCCVTALGCVVIVSNRRVEWRPPWQDYSSASLAPSYEIHTEGNRIFLFDKKSGQAWRYFEERDDKRQLVGEGFGEILFFPRSIQPPVAFTATPAPSPR